MCDLLSLQKKHKYLTSHEIGNDKKQKIHKKKIVHTYQLPTLIGKLVRLISDKLWRYKPGITWL